MKTKRVPKVKDHRRARVVPLLKLTAPAFLSLTLWVSPAEADVSSAMKDFWDGVGVSNATGPSAFAGQSAGYYTGGNLFLRTPVRIPRLPPLTCRHTGPGAGVLISMRAVFPSSTPTSWWP